MLIQPPFLKKNDKVAFIATAKNFEPKELTTGIKIVEGWGLRIIPGKNLYKQQHQFAGTDEERLEDLQNAINDEEIKAIFCVRGGYGTSRIIDQVNFKKIKKDPKWLVGFSDLTILHFQLHKLGLQSLHAIMPLSFYKDGTKESINTLKKALFGKKLSYTIAASPLNRSGKAKAELIGGNLSIINTIIGTKSDLDTKNKILFIEDIDENLYHIDRMMVHLKRAGKLDKLAGLIVGHLTDMKDNTVSFGKNAQEIILDAVKEYKYPVCFGFPVGHEVNNLALICGAETSLTVGAKNSEIKFF